MNANNTTKTTAKPSKHDWSRFDAMSDAQRPYIHQRLAVVEVPDKPIRHSIDLTKLSDEEVTQMERIVAKAGIEIHSGEIDETAL